MNIAIILFTLGIIMIVAGYTNQISPHCNKDLKIKIVSRNIYEEIVKNKELTDDTYRDMADIALDEDSQKRSDSITINPYE